MKICPKCKESKPITQFGNDRSTIDKKRCYCKDCANEYNKINYHTKRKSNDEKRLKFRAEKQRQVIQYLEHHPCVDCGISDIRVLDFDHIERNQKYKSVSWLIRHTYSISTVIEEIEKCEVRCANCHRIKTSKENEDWKYVYLESQSSQT